MSHGPLSYRRAVDACRSLDAGELYNPNTNPGRIPTRSQSCKMDSDDVVEAGNSAHIPMDGDGSDLDAK